MDGSLSASSSVYVSSTTSTVLGILSGSGTINGAVTLGQTAGGLTSSGAISTTSLVTGNPYATLTLAGGLTWNKAGTLNFNLGPSGQSGLLQLNSTAFNASVASPTTGYTFNFTNDGATVGTTYILVDYGTTNFTSATDFSASGGITGTFMENSLGGGLNDLTFTVTATPEPGAWVMMILGGLALALFESRRRRQTASTASVEGAGVTRRAGRACQGGKRVTDKLAGVSAYRNPNRAVFGRRLHRRLQHFDVADSLDQRD